jgi:hypothetical protein
MKIAELLVIAMYKEETKTHVEEIYGPRILNDLITLLLKKFKCED